MTNEEFLTQFTDLIRAAFDHEDPDFGELLVAVYMFMGYPDHVRKEAYRELEKVWERYGAMSRVAYDDGAPARAKDIRALMHFKESEVWKLVRRGKNEWPDDI